MKDMAFTKHERLYLRDYPDLDEAFCTGRLLSARGAQKA